MRTFTAQSTDQIEPRRSSLFRSFSSSHRDRDDGDTREFTPAQFVQETSEIGTDSVGEAQMSSKPENQLSDFTLRLLFVLFMALNMLNNMDHGVLPAGSIVIKDDLNLNNLQYGMIGSAVFGGLVLGKFSCS